MALLARPPYTTGSQETHPQPGRLVIRDSNQASIAARQPLTAVDRIPVRLKTVRHDEPQTS